MADKKKFNLNKRSHHNFELGKEKSSRTFDLTKDSNEVVENNGGLSNNPEVLTGSNSTNKKMWIWIICGIIVIGLLVWWIVATVRSEEKGGDENNSTPMTEEVAETPKTAVEVTENKVNDEKNTNVAPISDQKTVTESTPSDVQKTEQTISEPSSPQKEASVANEPQKSSTPQLTTQNKPVGSTKVSNDVDKEAMNVIKGKYGNNPVRKKKLGSKYKDIQKRVNELKKEGAF